MLNTAKKPYAAFLTHDWGTDERGRSNHDRVVQLAKRLKERGLPVWLDEHEMTGDIVDQMCSGIDDSDTVVVFITDRYLKKVGGSNAKDNCKREFSYATRIASASSMIPVVMEERVSNSNTWIGPVGMELGGVLYVKMWDDLDDGLELLIREIIRRAPAWEQHVAIPIETSTEAPTDGPGQPAADPDSETARGSDNMARERTLQLAAQAASSGSSAAHHAQLTASRASQSRIIKFASL